MPTTQLLKSEKPLVAYLTGKQVPKGVVKLSGAKNAATRMLAATTLTDETVVLTNFPTQLVDVWHKVNFMRNAGATIEINHESAELTASSATYGEASFFMGEGRFPIRTTYLLVAGQIRKSGRAKIPYPGGCKIGSRGYDLHMMVWRALGCEVNEKPEYIEIIGDKFTANRIYFPISTVGGTENALMCASIADGTTEIVNAYITPEISDLIELLRRMGAEIEVFGNSLVRVSGRNKLSGARKEVMSDRIEALTWIVYAVMSGGEIRIDNVPFSAMEVPLIHIEEAGVDLMKSRTSVYVHPDCLLAGAVQPFELACGTHPGVISDMQPFYSLLGLVANGTSRIFDYRYPERISYIKELAKLCGSDMISGESGRITTRGIAQLKGAHVTSTDLRGSMALVMAGLCADGQTIVDDVHMALRGYNDLTGKLKGLGVSIDVRES